MVRKDVGKMTAAGFGYIDVGAASQVLVLARGGVQGLEGMEGLIPSTLKGLSGTVQGP